MTSAIDRKLLLRTAADLCRRQSQRRTEATWPEPPVEAWRRCVRALELAELAQTRGWGAAARQCRERLRGCVADLRRQLDHLAAEVAATPAPRVIPIREIVDDLLALEAEYGELSIVRGDGTLAVTTDEIVLEEFSLGQFKITLFIREWGELRTPYRITALEPRPSTIDAEVVHPHVRGDLLCEGNASIPIRSALADGRLFDFFTIVAQTLASYNRHSAFVRIDEWQGATCSDCGDSVSGDDRSICADCEAELCTDCAVSCAACDDYFCSNCTASCGDCGLWHCVACLSRCPACREHFCKGCLDDEQCASCRRKSADDDDPTGAPPANSDAATDAVRLGQTGLSP